MADAMKKPWERVASEEPIKKPLTVLNKEILEKNSVRNREEAMKRRIAEIRAGRDFSSNGSVAEWLKNNPTIKRCLQLYTNCRFMDHTDVKPLEDIDNRSFIEFGPNFDVRMLSDSPRHGFLVQDTATIEDSLTIDRVDDTNECVSEPMLTPNPVQSA